MIRSLLNLSILIALVALVGCSSGPPPADPGNVDPGQSATSQPAAHSTSDGTSDPTPKPSGGHAATPAPATKNYDRPGYTTEVVNGRLWVFPAGSDKERSDKHVTFIRSGPDNMTVKAPDRTIALGYLATVPGFDVRIVDGRVHVTTKGGGGEFGDKHVTRIGAGPKRATVKAPDKETLDAYCDQLKMQ